MTDHSKLSKDIGVLEGAVTSLTNSHKEHMRMQREDTAKIENKLDTMTSSMIAVEMNHDAMEGRIARVEGQYKALRQDLRPLQDLKTKGAFLLSILGMFTAFISFMTVKFAPIVMKVLP